MPGRSLASATLRRGGAMRNWAALLLMVTAGCTGCSGGETPPSPEEDAVRDGGIWSPDRGAGIEVLARGRSLPPAHLASAAELRPDAGPGPFSDMRIHVDLSGTVRTVPCAVPSGSYCDGFAVIDLSGATIAVDTYASLGAKPACRSRWAEGTRVASLSGVWQQRASGAGRGVCRPELGRGPPARRRLGPRSSGLGARRRRRAVEEQLGSLRPRD